MTKKELIEQLENYPDNAEVVVNVEDTKAGLLHSFPILGVAPLDGTSEDEIRPIELEIEGFQL